MIRNGKPTFIFILSASVLSALVAAASVYLFMAAGRGQLPKPVISKIFTPAAVSDIVEPQPISIPRPAIVLTPGMPIAVPFLINLSSGTATLASASDLTSALGPQALASPSPAQPLTPANIASDEPGPAPPPVTADEPKQPDNSDDNGDGVVPAKDNDKSKDDETKAKNDSKGKGAVQAKDNGVNNVSTKSSSGKKKQRIHSEDQKIIQP